MRVGKLLPAAIIFGVLWFTWRFIVAVFVWLPWWADSGLLFALATFAPEWLGIAIQGKPLRREQRINEEQLRSHEAAFADLDRQRAELTALEDELARREAILARYREERRDTRLAERIGQQIRQSREEQR